MEIEGSVALITGANRGLGRSLAEAILGASAAKVYAAARDPSSIRCSAFSPIKLDVTRKDEVEAAAAECSDVNILVNNAGIMHSSPMLAEGSEAAMRHEMEVNVYGMLRMMQVFAPVLARNGGGVIVNILSVVSWFTVPFNATYCATKHAALSVSDAARIQLKAQGTRVVTVHAGYIDTDMAAAVNGPKTSPHQVAEYTLAAIRTGEDMVLADERAQQVWQAMRTDPQGFAKGMQKLWDDSQRG